MRHFILLFITLSLATSCNKSPIEDYISKQKLTYKVIKQNLSSDNTKKLGPGSMLEGDLTGDGSVDYVCIIFDKEESAHNIFIVHSGTNSAAPSSFLIGKNDNSLYRQRYGEIDIFKDYFIANDMDWIIDTEYNIFGEGDSSINVIAIDDGFNAWELKFDRGLGIYELIVHSE